MEITKADFKEELMMVLMGEYGISNPKDLVDFSESTYQKEMELAIEFQELSFELMDDVCNKLASFHREHSAN